MNQNNPRRHKVAGGWLCTRDKGAARRIERFGGSCTRFRVGRLCFRFSLPLLQGPHQLHTSPASRSRTARKADVMLPKNGSCNNMCSLSWKQCGLLYETMTLMAQACHQVAAKANAFARPYVYIRRHSHFLLPPPHAISTHTVFPLHIQGCSGADVSLDQLLARLHLAKQPGIADDSRRVLHLAARLI